MIIEGILFFWLAKRKTNTESVEDNGRQPVSTPILVIDPITERKALLVLASITLLTIGLRLYRLGSSLWLDEITPLLLYNDASIIQIITSFISSNNHLLNTLLVKLSIGTFGEMESTVRLPAFVFGVATIPLMYSFARLTFSQGPSLGITLLLASSYHHIYFSQNARGYSAYLFFSLLSSFYFIKGLQDDDLKNWVYYGLSMFLNFASILISIFVFTGHILVGAVMLIRIKLRGSSPIPLFKRLTAVFAATGFLGFQLYANAIPQMYVYMKTVYVSPAAGFKLFSLEFLLELWRGISVGLGTVLLLGIIPGAALVGIGLFRQLRNNWMVMAVLMIPGILQAIFAIITGSITSPRFYILFLPLAILIMVQGIEWLSEKISKWLKKGDDYVSRISNSLVLLISIAFIFQLGNYYSIPKQAFRESLEYIESVREADEIVIVVHIAEAGIRYYGEQYNLAEGEDYFYTRTIEKFDQILTANPGKESIIVTTFHRALRIELPELFSQIEDDWVIEKTFQGTIGDGAISVWRWRE
ncbi:MAG: hypothetical protein FVQ83_08535 [Chloroflexi bacterium]|nr:hypothetical protein [Chloroflexota bacterium]